MLQYLKYLLFVENYERKEIENTYSYLSAL